MKSMDILKYPVIFKAFWINQKPAAAKAVWQRHGSSLSGPRLRNSPPSSRNPGQRMGLPRSNAIPMRSKSRAWMEMSPGQGVMVMGIKGLRVGEMMMDIFRYFGVIDIYIYITIIIHIHIAESLYI